jgi:hypothetical protein
MSSVICAPPPPTSNSSPELITSIKTRIAAFAEAHFMTYGAALLEYLFENAPSERKFQAILYCLNTGNFESIEGVYTKDSPIFELVEDLKKLSSSERNEILSQSISIGFSLSPEENLMTSLKELRRLQCLSYLTYRVSMIATQGLALQRNLCFPRPLLFEDAYFPSTTNLTASLASVVMESKSKSSLESKKFLKNKTSHMKKEIHPETHQNSATAFKKCYSSIFFNRIKQKSIAQALFGKIYGSTNCLNVIENTGLDELELVSESSDHPTLEFSHVMDHGKDLCDEMERICDCLNQSVKDAPEFHRFFQYLPLMLLLFEQELIKASQDPLSSKLDQIRSMMTTVPEKFCEIYALPYAWTTKESAITSPQTLTDPKLLEKLSKARSEISKLELVNEQYHQAAVERLIDKFNILSMWWIKWVSPSITRGQKIAKLQYNLSKIPPSPPQVVERVPSPPLELEVCATAPPAPVLNLNILHELALSSLKGGTSLLHFCIAHESIQTPYDIFEAMITLHLTCENLLSDKDHSMPEMKDMEKLEIFSRQLNRLLSNSRGEAQCLLAEVCEVIKGDFSSEDLITHYQNYLLKTLDIYLSHLDGKDTLNQQLMLLAEQPLKISLEEASTSSEALLVESMLPLISGDANFHLLRLRSLLNKDMSRSVCSYQTTTALHLIGVIVEEALFNKYPKERAKGHNLHWFPTEDPALKSWLTQLHQLSVQSRYDDQRAKGGLPSISRDASKQDGASRTAKPKGEEGTIMGKDMGYTRTELTFHLNNLKVLLTELL